MNDGDRTLLKRAAKTAGITLWHEDVFTDGLTQKVNENGILRWNPLEDDGDALRLAVRLNLTIKIMNDHVKVGWRGIGEQWPGEEAPIPSELPAATRRAIVRAAAAMAGG